MRLLSLFLAGSLLGGLPSLPPIIRQPSVTYLDRTGVVIGVRGGRIAPPVDLDYLPAYVPAAFVAIEDRRFYDHPGFDAIGMARALVADVARGRTAEGASTITQQLARNLFLNSDQTMERKAKELVYAVELERAFSKRQILALYLSRIYFGSGAYGLEAASRRYFGVPAAKLNVRQAAALAAIPKSPSGYNPVDQPERSEERTRLVLDAMVEMGALSPAGRDAALAEPLHLHPVDRTMAAQYFVDWVDEQRRALVAKPTHDLTVQTTLDLHMEDAAEAATQGVLRRSESLGVQQAALVSQNGDGAVRAMIGGADYRQSQFNRATQAVRQAGSAWKPFVYLTALEAGRTPDTLAIDQPVAIRGWSPHDDEPGYLGQITFETALAKSINTVAAQVADEVGQQTVAATARRLGIVTPISTDPAMALGTSGVTPIEMAGAYDAFANGGRLARPYGLQSIRSNGVVIWRRPAAALPQVVDNPALQELDQMLRAVVARGTGVRAAIAGRDIAGKTGTTSSNKDAWFCGFTGDLTTVVWVGRDDARPMRGVMGGGPPTAIWRAFMVGALRNTPAIPIPAGPPASVVAPPAVQDPVTQLLNETGPSSQPETEPTPQR